MTSVSITSFGAVGDGATNNQAAIQAAFNYAAANGASVYVPAGTFAYSGTLTANGISVTGAGTGSILKAQDGANESLILTGNGGAVSNLQMDGVTSLGRLSTLQSGEIWAHNASNYTVQNVLINGSSSVGIVSDNSSNGTIIGNTVENTLADSIHNTDGSNHISITQNRILNSGDDGISVVSYSNQPIVHDITISGNTVLGNNNGRGLSVVGGSTVTISGNHVEGGTADAAGIYIAAEAEWHTDGVSNVAVTGNTLINTGGVVTGHGSITLYNSVAGSTTVSGVTVSGNQIVDPRSAGILVVGAGSEQLSLQNNTVYTPAGHALVTDINSAAVISSSGNLLYPATSYGTPLVPAGGGVGTTATAGSGSGTTSGGATAGGSDSIVIHVSADADPTFKLLVDGVQVGGEYAPTNASHYNNQWQDITVTGNYSLGSGTHHIALVLDNVTAGSHRALYVGSLTVDGTSYAGTGAVNTASLGHTDTNDAPMLTDGSLTFTTTGGTVSGGTSSSTSGGSTTTTGGTTTSSGGGTTTTGSGGTTSSGTTTATDTTPHLLSTAERLGFVSWESQHITGMESTVPITSALLSSVTGLTINVVNGALSLVATDTAAVLPVAGAPHVMSSSELILLNNWEGQHPSSLSATTTLTATLLSGMHEAVFSVAPPAHTATAGGTVTAAALSSTPLPVSGDVHDSSALTHGMDLHSQLTSAMIAFNQHS